MTATKWPNTLNKSTPSSLSAHPHTGQLHQQSSHRARSHPAYSVCVCVTPKTNPLVIIDFVDFHLAATSKPSPVR